MASVSYLKLESITTSTTPGKSDVEVTYAITFDNYDVAVDQTYHGELDIVGDDHLPGEDGVNDSLWKKGLGDFKASTSTWPLQNIVERTITIPVTTKQLNEDKDSTPNPDEIRVFVSLTPTGIHTPVKIVSDLSNVKKLTL